MDINYNLKTFSKSSKPFVLFVSDKSLCTSYVRGRPVVPGSAGGAMVPPDFGRSVNPISTKGGRLCPPNNTGTPGFSDLPTALEAESHFCLVHGLTSIIYAFNFFMT